VSKTKKKRAINLFSGCGGTGWGIEATGLYRSIGYDNWPIAVETHNLNGMKSICADLNVRLPKAKKTIDLVWASCPCQPFSNSREQQGQFDPRDGFPAYLRTLRKFRPRLTIFENVPGLTYKRHSEYLALIIRKIEQLGYKVEWRILDAADYGVPQVRRRIILIGRLDDDPTFPKPIVKKHVTVFEALGTDGSDNPPGIDVKYLKTPSFATGFKGSLLFNGRGRPLDIHAPSKTIYAAGGNHVHWFDVENQAHAVLRAPASRRQDPHRQEGEGSSPSHTRADGDTPQFAGLPSNVVKQIGNACPPQLARAVVEANQP
jgi:DNA (cytosine-5)-methyltransferase 1